MARVQVYSTLACGHCVRAKALLREKGIEFDDIDITMDSGKRSWLLSATGRRTVPQIFIDGKSIGGFIELAALQRSGELDRQLGSEPTT